MTTVDEARAKLTSGGFPVEVEKAMTDGRGKQLRLANGAIVNCFNNGTIQVQGKQQESVKVCLGLISPGLEQPVGAGYSTLSKVFVVYGHDTTAKTALEAMLRRWKLEPLILDQLPSEGGTIIEKLEKYTNDVNFAVVLATPDDIGHRVGHDDEKRYRARQNVVLELGMLLARLGRSKVAILMKSQDDMERPSDIQGLLYIPFKDDLGKEAGPLLAKEMGGQGYQITIMDL